MGTWFKQSFFIHLIVEELLLNIMKFGIGETDKKYYVSVKVMDNNGECILRIRDNVNSYNPFDLRGDEVDRAVMEMIKKKGEVLWVSEKAGVQLSLCDDLTCFTYGNMLNWV